MNVENTGHSFISYFKRATRPLVVLNFLKEQPMYGYEITEAGRACPKKPGMSIGKPDVFEALMKDCPPLHRERAKAAFRLRPDYQLGVSAHRHPGRSIAIGIK